MAPATDAIGRNPMEGWPRTAACGIIRRRGWAPARARGTAQAAVEKDEPPTLIIDRSRADRVIRAGDGKDAERAGSRVRRRLRDQGSRPLMGANGGVEERAEGNAHGRVDQDVALGQLVAECTWRVSPSGELSRLPLYDVMG